MSAGASDLVVVLRRSRPEPQVAVLRGTRQAGESVLAAARTTLAGLTGPSDGAADVWAVDLSRSPGVLAVDVPDGPSGEGRGLEWLGPEGLAARLPDDVAVERAAAVPRVSIAFRPMTRADFTDVVEWQARPHVSRWWSSDAADVAGAERHYGPALDGDDPTRMWVLEVNGRSVGMLQDYRVGDHPDYALLTARPDAVGMDYLVGEPSWVGTGVGTRILWTYLRDVVRPRYPSAGEFFAAPDHRNAASLRVLDKLGFTRGLWFDEPQRDGRVAGYPRVIDSAPCLTCSPSTDGPAACPRGDGCSRRCSR